MRVSERVREAFAENFDKRGDVGAAVAVFIERPSGGRPVGRSCRQGTHPPMGTRHDRERLFCTKGIAATCVHRLVERGKIGPGCAGRALLA